MALYELDPNHVDFPPAQLALNEPNGLLAIGGDLSVSRILNAYHSGIFPWFNEGEPILWWSPDPRGILIPNQIHISRSLRKNIKKQNFQFTLNQSFNEVINQCAQQRIAKEGTWISEQISQAYQQLHQHGHAYSIEVWQNEQLVGGLYGVLVGGVFCGESMFHITTDASKAALLCLTQHCLATGIELIDCQMLNPHLATLGVVEMRRATFLTHLKRLKSKTINLDHWRKQKNLAVKI